MSEFKAEIVELCQRGDRSVAQVARDFDLTETAVRAWVRQAELGAGERTDGVTSAEREELAALRAENRPSRICSPMRAARRAIPEGMAEATVGFSAQAEPGQSAEADRCRFLAVCRKTSQPADASIGQVIVR
jgi:transposase-like protein